MRFLRTLLSCSAAAFVLAAATLVVQAPAAQAQDVIRCAYPYWFGFAPTPVAMGMGYFKEEGLEVETVFDNDRANVLPGLEIGDIDCTMRTIGEHMSRPLEADSNLVVIGVIDVSVGADGVVGAPGINEVTDLVGKIFAGEINHPGTIMTAHALKLAGYDFNKDVEVRLIATDDASAVFEDSSVAAVATWEPMLSEIVANTSRKGSKILLSSADFNGLITDVVIVNCRGVAQQFFGFVFGKRCLGGDVENGIIVHLGVEGEAMSQGDVADIDASIEPVERHLVWRLGEEP